MNRNKNLPLSEINFYILLAVSEPAHGYLIMQKVEELSRGEVRVAAGTLYGAIENLLKARFITPVDGEDSRRKVYALTEEGRQIVQLDMERMKLMVLQAESCLREREG